jgi:hypothetical protein
VGPPQPVAATASHAAALVRGNCDHCTHSQITAPTHRSPPPLTDHRPHSQICWSAQGSDVHCSPLAANLAQPLLGFSWVVITTHLGSGLTTSRVPLAFRYAQSLGSTGATAATQPGVSSQ